jgi:hypothetical protein
MQVSAYSGSAGWHLCGASPADPRRGGGRQEEAGRYHQVHCFKGTLTVYSLGNFTFKAESHRIFNRWSQAFE